MYTVRDLLIDSLIEAKLASRSQSIPGTMIESAFQLLKKRLAEYSNTNYLSFIRKEYNFEQNKPSILIGEYELRDNFILNENFFDVKTTDDLPDASSVPDDSRALVRYYEGEYNPWIANTMGVPGGRIWVAHTSVKPSDFMKFWPDVEINNLQEIVRCYKQIGSEWEELNFVAYEDFYGFNANNVYSYKPENDSIITFYTKEPGNYKLIYNEKYEIKLDDELRIPGQFISLFTAALVYDLAVAYPRLSDGTVQLLHEKLVKLEENVRRSSAANKFITRKVTRENCTWNDFVNGTFLNI